MLLELLVAAASSGRPALEALRPVMERAARERIVLRYGATGTFARQIESGAPFDLFFAADEMTPRLLGARQLLDPRTLRIYAEGALVLIEGADASIELPAQVGAAWLAKLPALSFRKVAIASPKVAPYGRAAREALTRAGVWDALFPRIVTSASVEEAATFVESGDAEIGLVAASVALRPGVRSAPVDPSLHARLLQMAGVVRASRKRDAALRALEAATGPASRTTWERAGFRASWTAPGPAAPR